MWEGPEICAGGLYCLLSTDGLKHETVPPPTYLARHHARFYTSFTTCHGENESSPSTASHRGHRHHACDATVSPISWNLAPRQLGLES